MFFQLLPIFSLSMLSIASIPPQNLPWFPLLSYHLLLLTLIVTLLLNALMDRYSICFPPYLISIYIVIPLVSKGKLSQIFSSDVFIGCINPEPLFRTLPTALPTLNHSNASAGSP